LPALTQVNFFEENNMSWLLATFKVKEGKQPDFEMIMNSLVEKVRASEPNTLVYVLTKSKRDPTEYVMIEQYKSDDDRKAHGQTPYFQEALPQFMACLEGNPQMSSLIPVSA
jgi:quinol monooxygenase YgiN